MDSMPAYKFSPSALAGRAAHERQKGIKRGRGFGPASRYHGAASVERVIATSLMAYLTLLKFGHQDISKQESYSVPMLTPIVACHLSLIEMEHSVEQYLR